MTVTVSPQQCRKSSIFLDRILHVRGQIKSQDFSAQIAIPKPSIWTKVMKFWPTAWTIPISYPRCHLTHLSNWECIWYLHEISWIFICVYIYNESYIFLSDYIYSYCISIKYPLSPRSSHPRYPRGWDWCALLPSAVPPPRHASRPAHCLGRHVQQPRNGVI